MRLPNLTNFIYVFEIEELKSLYRLLERNWINPENVLGNQTVNRIMKIIAEHEQRELDTKSS